ncbi:DNA-binding protein [Oscillatoria salina IIICB1]|nr:DNA-binding protein [Oscillatoria salina IIICB1]NET88842.1 DNA-binding protein [Kamptonema sp. SIO1D9]
MIKNEQQYKNTLDWIDKFQQSLAGLDRDEDKRKNDPEGWELLYNSFQSQLLRLKQEINEYEFLRSHSQSQPIVLKISDIDCLAEICIKARLAAKLSCEELGELSGISAEKIREYEETDYENASFLAVKSVIDALNIKLKTGEFVVSLDTLRRTPITKEELLQTKSTELR